MQTYTNIHGKECVIIQNESGTTWSGLKSAYDAMQAEQSTPIVTEDE
jgi:hypothetical protein